MFTMGEDMMKQWAENWEKLMGDHLEKLVHNEKFISEMSKSIAATMTGKAMYSKALDEQMAAMNLPSRTEIIKILQKLTDIEERVIDLTERFEDFVDAQQSKPADQAAQQTATHAAKPAADAPARDGKAKKQKK
ncbi:MAG: hypothetical protein ACD_39C00893G0001 [uncultured bacterium]|nr:MAG: hypothetical protein ACD_39C00893G0001 [uncultured bacterium]